MANEFIPAKDVAKRFVETARESIDKLPMEQVRGIAAMGDKPIGITAGVKSAVVACAIIAARDRVREVDGHPEAGSSSPD